MKILFLDQSGKLGGAELCLLDIAESYRDRCQVGLFADGPFKILLEQQQIPVQILTQQAIQIRKDSNWLQGLASLRQLLPLVAQVAQLARNADLIYANTQKALVVGAIASWISRRPLVYHLHDILSGEHFSPVNRRIAITLANRFAVHVIATSDACKTAFIAAGGRPERVSVVYNGFDVSLYQSSSELLRQAAHLRQQLGLAERFVVGHFSRLSPWKGQHVLIQALTQCPAEVVAVFVGDALFGEDDYLQQLQTQVAELGLHDRVRFLGFRSDVIPLMAACDVITHTSIAPEPFGRVIAEAMLAGKPVIAAQAGGAIEVIDVGKTGWLVPPNDAEALARAIVDCRNHPAEARAIAQAAQQQASQRFNLTLIRQQIADLLEQISPERPASVI